MMNYFKYFKYLIKHKFYVGIECFKRGLFWQGIIHDWHKFTFKEFIPYANHFFKKNIVRDRDKTGYYKPYPIKDKYKWVD